MLGGMLAGADSIDDLDVLRAGASPVLFDDLRAPSTIGTWLRGFKWANVRQLDAVGRIIMSRAWAARLGPADLAAPMTVDIDTSICQTYGLAKQGGRFGYTHVRGYHPLLATIAGTGEVAHSRMRGGNAGSARGARTFTAETLSRIRDAGATGQITGHPDGDTDGSGQLGALALAQPHRHRQRGADEGGQWCGHAHRADRQRVEVQD